MIQIRNQNAYDTCPVFKRFLASSFGVYSSSRIADSIFFLVSSATYPLPLITLDTVPTPTPAFCATSLILAIISFLINPAVLHLSTDLLLLTSLTSNDFNFCVYTVLLEVLPEYDNLFCYSQIL